MVEYYISGKSATATARLDAGESLREFRARIEKRVSEPVAILRIWSLQPLL